MPHLEDIEVFVFRDSNGITYSVFCNLSQTQEQWHTYILREGELRPLDANSRLRRYVIEGELLEELLRLERPENLKLTAWYPAVGGDGITTLGCGRFGLYTHLGLRTPTIEPHFTTPEETAYV